MHTKQKDEEIERLTNEQFTLNQLISNLQGKWRDTNYVEIKVEKIKQAISLLINC